LGPKNYYTIWENKDSIENKKNGINNNNYFQNYILNDSSIFNLIQEENFLKYYEIISQNYLANISLFPNIFSFIDVNQKNQIYLNIKKEFNEFLTYLIYPSFFSNKDFETIYHIKTNIFESFRYLNPENGDSFYRAFIFSLFENYIINQELDSFCIILFDIYRLNQISPIYDGLNIEKSLVIFNIIYDLMRAEQWDDAYEILLFSFIEIDNSFDQVLIRYVRYCVFGYLINLEIINSSNQNVKHMKKNFNYKLGIMYYNEPNRNVIDSLPNIFNVNLNIFYIEGDMKEFKKKDFTRIQSNLTINIGYFYTNYHILYQNSNKIKKIFNKNNPNINHILSVEKIEQKKQCSKCNTNSTYVNFPKEKKSICSNCLDQKIIEILKERIQLCFQENYINYSFYMRPIKITKEIQISDLDYIYLFKNSFTEKCSKTLISLCYKCTKDFQNLIELSCGCHYCKECLLDLINISTDSKIILNGFEKNSKSKTKCHCGNDFNFEDAIDKISDINFDEYENKAEERMINYVEELCLICLKKFEKNMNVRSNHKKPSYYEIDIIIHKQFIKENYMKGLDYVDERHIICSDCFEKLSENKEKNNFVVDGKEYKILNCLICDMNHLVDKIKWKKLLPKPACSKGCFVF